MSGTIIGNNIAIVAKGTTTIGSLATLTLATLTRTNGKIPRAIGFTTTNISGTNVGDSGATINLTVQRTATLNEYNVVAQNTSALSRVLEWKVFEL